MQDKDVEFEDEAKQSFEPPDKDYLLWELEQAIDVTLDEYIDTEDRTDRLKESENMMWTNQERLIIGNQATIMQALRLLLEDQATIMQALRLLLEEKKDEPDKETT